MDALLSKSVKELKEIAKQRGLSGYSRLRKDELVRFLANTQVGSPAPFHKDCMKNRKDRIVRELVGASIELRHPNGKTKLKKEMCDDLLKHEMQHFPTISVVAMLRKLDEKIGEPVTAKLYDIEDELLDMGWTSETEEDFLTPENIVFLFMVLHKGREIENRRVRMGEKRRKQMLGAGIYLAYSYIGAETGYPFPPFLMTANQSEFWDCNIELANALSAKMLRYNTDHKRLFKQWYLKLVA